MTPEQVNTLIASTPLAWITFNKFVNENQRGIEFKNHRFMIDVYADNHPDIVCIKSAQVGFSVYAILKSFHEAIYEKRNIIYALPTKNVVQDFVVPKVNPLISGNPSISSKVGADSVSLKKIGDRFIYYKGGSEREAISVSADTLVIDELDRMPDMNVVTMFDSRLQASEAPRRRRFSNGSMVGFGVDGLYKTSNMFHWFIKCSHCNHDWYIEYYKDDLHSHYVDKEQAIFACGKCGRELTNEDRRMGRWVAKYPSRDRHGYWISQMMAPWVSAQRIMEQEEDMDIATFHGFVLGKAYTPEDMIVNRESILRATAPSLIPKTNVVIGVDQNVNEQIWVAGTPNGIFAHGRTKSWEEFEHLKLMYNAFVVSDPMPFPVMPRQLASKYKDFYMCRFKQFDGLQTVQWDDPKRVVYVDRTRGLDTVATEIAQAKLLFREHPNALEDYIADWGNLYRTTVEKPNGKIVSEWLKKENKESDFSLATLYWRVGMARMLAGSAGRADFAEPLANKEAKADYVDTQGRLITDMGNKVEQALNGAGSSDDWRYN